MSIKIPVTERFSSIEKVWQEPSFRTEPFWFFFNLILYAVEAYHFYLTSQPEGLE